jgi:pimeloyl-ACP methyl ester carboxylesterase
VHKLDSGKGPVAVFVHGFCQSSAYWAPSVERLAAQGGRGIAVDLPGFGASAREAGPYTMPGLADALERQLAAWGLGPVMLVGGSMGGVVAQHLALRHPSRVARLLLVATGAFTANEAVALEKADQMAAAPWNEATVTPVVDGFFFKAPDAASVARYRAIALSASQPAAVEAARSNARNRTMEALTSIRVPTMIVQGRHDKARTPEHGALMQAHVAGSTLAVIEDAGHTPQLEQPGAFHDVAMPFLAAHR